jgi:hypothetical protein
MRQRSVFGHDLPLIVNRSTSSPVDERAHGTIRPPQADHEARGRSRGRAPRASTTNAPCSSASIRADCRPDARRRSARVVVRPRCAGDEPHLARRARARSAPCRAEPAEPARRETTTTSVPALRGFVTRATIVVPSGTRINGPGTLARFPRSANARTDESRLIVAIRPPVHLAHLEVAASAPRRAASRRRAVVVDRRTFGRQAARSVDRGW